MRNYSSLNITYLAKDRLAIEQAFPQRMRHNGGSFGPGFEVTKSSSYEFDPPLTKEEIVGLTAKLVDLGVKSFEFVDVTSLGEDLR